jgi:hypothetical protein
MLPPKLKYKRGFTDINTLFFINSENEKITVFSPYTQIIKEFNKLGITTKDATLEEMLSKLSLLILNEYVKRLNKDEEYCMNQFNKTEFYQKHATLLYHVKEVSYNLYDYKLEKMPGGIKHFYKVRIDPKRQPN